MNELYLEYARVIKMCEGTKVKPWECVKVEYTEFSYHPEFTRLPPGELKFAIAILEDKPVFVGDKVWSRISDRYTPISPSDGSISHEYYTWHKPKRTFTINGIQLNCPVKNITAHKTVFLSDHCVYWDNAFDHNAFSSALQDILIQARDKP